MRLACRARTARLGQTLNSLAQTWWHKLGGQLKLGSLLDKRYVRYDNALVISAFKPSEFEPEIHSTSYRCQAQNSFGTIVSREVVINAGKCRVLVVGWTFCCCCCCC